MIALTETQTVTTVTIDTNVLVLGVDPARKEEWSTFHTLLDLRMRKVVEVAKTSRFHEDKALDMEVERVKWHYRIADQFPTIPAVFRFNVGLIGVDLEADMDLFNRLSALFDDTSSRPNTKWDIDHLYGHLAAKRDYFLTYERRILNKAADLALVDIRVMDPKEFVDVASAVLRDTSRNSSPPGSLLRAEVEAAFNASLARRPPPRHARPTPQRSG